MFEVFWLVYDIEHLFSIILMLVEEKGTFPKHHIELQPVKCRSKRRRRISEKKTPKVKFLDHTLGLPRL